MLNNGFFIQEKKEKAYQSRYFGFKKAHRFKLCFAERFCIYNENHQKQGWK